MFSGGLAILFGRFPADRPKFRPGRGGDPQVKNPKNAIFSIFPKFDLDDSRYRITVPNHSRTPKMSFSGHITQVGKQGGFSPVNVIFEEKNFRI